MLVTSVSLFFYKNMRECGKTREKKIILRRTSFEDGTTLPGFPEKKRNNAKINIPNQLLPVEVYNQQRLPRRKMYIVSSQTRRNDFNAEFNENIEGARLWPSLGPLFKEQSTLTAFGACLLFLLKEICIRDTAF